MWVSCGYIVGFDGERGSVAPGVQELISASSTPIAMVGLLFALPGTQLTRRLEREGRLQKNFDIVVGHGEGPGDQCTAGLNFVTRRPRLDILRDYREIVDSIYSPGEYFARVAGVIAQLDCSQKKLSLTWRHYFRDVRGLSRILWRQGVLASYRLLFWRTLVKLLLTNPKSLRYGVNLMAFYLHFGPFSKYLLAQVDASIAAEEARAVPASTSLPMPLPVLV